MTKVKRMIPVAVVIAVLICCTAENNDSSEDGGENGSMRKETTSSGWKLCKPGEECPTVGEQSEACPRSEPNGNSLCSKPTVETCIYCPEYRGEWTECFCEDNYWDCGDLHCDPVFDPDDDGGV